MLGKTDILEIMKLPLYDDLRDEDYIVNEIDFDRVENKFMEFKDLNQKGYYSCFSWGFEMTKNIITEYLNK